MRKIIIVVCPECLGNGEVVNPVFLDGDIAYIKEPCARCSGEKVVCK